MMSQLRSMAAISTRRRDVIVDEGLVNIKTCRLAANWIV